MVYVDDMNYPYGRMKLCHMFADTIEELQQMADKIGIDRKWFQDKRKDFPHYDVSLSKKKLAIKYGAKEFPYRGILILIKGIQKLDEERKIKWNS